MNAVLPMLLRHSALLLLAVSLAVFGFLAPAYFTAANLLNLGTQTAPVLVVATGMTLVLVAGGVDLSVGATMFVAASLAGKLALGGSGLIVIVPLMLATGAACGGLNAVLIARFGLLAFVATLGTLYAGRGFALWLTETRALNLPDEFLQVGTARVCGIPLPVVIALTVVIAGQVTLSATPFGRRLYATGHNPDGARQAGLPVPRLLAAVYVISGICAALGGLLTLTQLGAVSPRFGLNAEFTAIAAAVLGGSSLFGGRGAVLPGTVAGALLMQSLENGLVVRNTDPYLFPLITSAVIFLALLIDSLRSGRAPGSSPSCRG